MTLIPGTDQQQDSIVDRQFDTHAPSLSLPIIQKVQKVREYTEMVDRQNVRKKETEKFTFMYNISLSRTSSARKDNHDVCLIRSVRHRKEITRKSCIDRIWQNFVLCPDIFFAEQHENLAITRSCFSKSPGALYGVPAHILTRFNEFSG